MRFPMFDYNERKSSTVAFVSKVNRQGSCIFATLVLSVPFWCWEMLPKMTVAAKHIRYFHTGSWWRQGSTIFLLWGVGSPKLYKFEIHMLRGRKTSILHGFMCDLRFSWLLPKKMRPLRQLLSPFFQPIVCIVSRYKRWPYDKLSKSFWASVWTGGGAFFSVQHRRDNATYKIVLELLVSNMWFQTCGFHFQSFSILGIDEHHAG